ncbi:MAG: ComF family protein [Oscillospiraceae bacterium]|nr:ComF family protein [Oscillospiraceae bacterium]
MKFLDKLIELAFPPKCIFCHKLLWRGDDDGDFICNSCENNLPRTTTANGVTTADFIAKCVSPLFYRDNVRESIHRFKFYRCQFYSTPYAHLIRECLDNHPDIKFDYITWVPLSKKRYRNRGYDQAQCLAEALARLFDIPLWGMLKKTRHTKAQSTLKDKSQRRANIAGAYALSHGIDIKGMSILLVDDVVTTGSTLSECAKVLLLGGAERIYCVTLAKAGTSKVKAKPKK